MKIQRTVPPAAAELPAIVLARAAMGLVLGRKYTRRLEDQLKAYFGVRHVFLTCSGKSALTLILRALTGLTRRRQVVIPAYTCFSVPAAVMRAGLDVRVCDIDPTTLDFDYASLARVLTDETLCVVATHLLGHPADVIRVTRMSRRAGAVVVEDAAQAMGGRDDGALLGTRGDVGFFSLGRGKPITCGAGGIVVTNSDAIGRALAEQYEAVPAPSVSAAVTDLLRLLLMRVFVHPRLFWGPKAIPRVGVGRTAYHVGFPIARLSGPSAGALQGWRERLSQTSRARSEIAAYFCAALGPRARWPGFPGSRLAVLTESRQARDRLYAASEARGLGLGLMYPAPITAIDELKARFAGAHVPGAQFVADRLLTLPTHHHLSEMDKRGVCELLHPHLPAQVAA